MILVWLITDDSLNSPTFPPPPPHQTFPPYSIYHVCHLPALTLMHLNVLLDDYLHYLHDALTCFTTPLGD